MLLPYRVKNPVRIFPWITYGLILGNILIYFTTTEPPLYFFIRNSVVEHFGFLPGGEWHPRGITALFLHGDLFHLIGNMFMLWLFGPSVEERLGAGRYLLLYLLAGFSGHLLYAITSIGEPLPLIGASGAIMGVLAAYYYIYSWCTVCIFYFFYFYFGTFEIKAAWVIGVYFVLDAVKGFLLTGSGSGGVAHFAHLGGFILGGLFCASARVRRDDPEVSEAKALHHDLKYLEALPLNALVPLSKQQPDDVDVFRALCLVAGRSGITDVIEEALSQNTAHFVQNVPQTVSACLLDFHANPTILQPSHYLRLSALLESGFQMKQATRILQLLVYAYPDAPEVESALFRLGKHYLSYWNNPEAAITYLSRLLKDYPGGGMEPFARELLEQAKSQRN